MTGILAGTAEITCRRQAHAELATHVQIQMARTRDEGLGAVLAECRPKAALGLKQAACSSKQKVLARCDNPASTSTPRFAGPVRRSIGGGLGEERLRRRLHGATITLRVAPRHQAVRENDVHLRQRAKP